MKSGGLLKILISALILVGCGQHNSGGYVKNINMVDTVPDTFEDPTLSLNTPATDDDQTKEDKLPPVLSEPPPLADADSDTDDKLTTSNKPKVSQFIKNAELVMVKEGKKIGTPCNFYLMRVLEVSGFSKKSFRANDFDLYAKKYFSHYKDKDFINDKQGSDKAELKRYLWSYPERTPFIMQWSRTGYYGHVAIVERIEDKLIVYQASIHSHTARRDQTSIDLLLNGFNRRKLTVYSEFTK